jgi:Fe-S cluster biogenesis protein NfuA
MDIICPRCHAPVDIEYYGPCDGCRSSLRATMSGEPGETTQVVEYEPKMNVTPNAVALKDD